MKVGIFAILVGIFAPLVSAHGNEGVPSYYQGTSAGARGGYNQYSTQGYTRYAGQSTNGQIVGNRTYTYQVPRPQPAPQIYAGAMTTNGVAIPEEKKTNIYASYGRRFADFEFETGVNSILEWDDMVFNEITVGAEHVFNLRNFDLFAYGEYTYGDLSHGGLSMDYDLLPFDEADPLYGIFTISMGDQTGDSHHLRLGFGAHHVWDIGGWKISPSIGYEIFKHNLEMSNHIYPNPGVYLPLMTYNGEYVYGTDTGEFFSAPQGYDPLDWAPTNASEVYQVCMSPEDIKVVNGTGQFGDALTTVDWNSSMGYQPWGVAEGECIVIGGDGPIVVEGTTHIYDTTWSGFYIGLEVEKQMTLSDKLRFYVQFGMPKYSSEGTWPNRTDWQQNPSFLDEGDEGAYSYMAEMEYNLRVSDRLQLTIKADTNVFHVGNIGGELYVAEYSQWVTDEYGDIFLDDNDMPVLETIPAHTEQVTDSLKRATWQSFGLHVGFKFAF